jgi:hypothetical protein
MPAMSRNMHSKQIVDEPLETLHFILGGQGGPIGRFLRRTTLRKNEA